MFYTIDFLYESEKKQKFTV